MDTIVLKFGGSSVADNIKLNIVADKIVELKEKGNRIVVVVSAQGKTTDTLIKEAKELCALPDDREMDVLLSSGEQISMSKLAILLKMLGHDSISLTGWQAGIVTTEENQNAKIDFIQTHRLIKELDAGRIVIVAGFQGINENEDITTLGRGGSDTTAVAIASALNAKHCYIFSDVDGVYSADPNKVTIAKKLESLSYTEMIEIAGEGAKVLHNRCIEIGEKFSIPIVTKSTFNNKPGTVIESKIEDTSVKSIVKNDDIIRINLKYETYSISLFNQLYHKLLSHHIEPKNLINNSTHSLDVDFTIKATTLLKFQNVLETELNMFNATFSNITRIAIVGHGIMNDPHIMEEIMKIIEINNLEIYSIDMNEAKIVVMLKEKASNPILEQLHKALIY